MRPHATARLHGASHPHPAPSSARGAPRLRTGAVTRLVVALLAGGVASGLAPARVDAQFLTAPGALFAGGTLVTFNEFAGAGQRITAPTAPNGLALQTSSDGTPIGVSFATAVGSSVTAGIATTGTSGLGGLMPPAQSICTNGAWQAATKTPFAGVGPGGFMRFTFATLVGGVGGFMNYAPVSPDPVTCPPAVADFYVEGRGNPILRLLGEGDVVLATYEIDALARIDTPGALNAGAFRGAYRAEGDIRAVEIGGAFLWLDDLQVVTAAAAPPPTVVPEPSVLGLVALGLWTLALLRRRGRGAHPPRLAAAAGLLALAGETAHAQARPAVAPARPAATKPTPTTRVAPSGGAPAVSPAILAQLRSRVLRGNFDAATALGRLGAPTALPVLREVIDDVDPGVRRTAAFLAAEIGRPAAPACPALLKELADTPWDGARVRTPVLDVQAIYPFHALAAVGCPAGPSADALASVARRLTTRPRGARGHEAQAALARVFAAAAAYGDSLRGRFDVPLRAVLADSTVDAQGEPSVGEAWDAGMAYRLLAAVDLWTPDLEALVLRRLFPEGLTFGDRPAWAGVYDGAARDAGPWGDALALLAFARRPERARAIGERVLRAPPDTNLAQARVHRVRAYHLLGVAGAAAVPAIVAGLRADVAAQTAWEAQPPATRGEMPVPGQVALEGAFDALRRLGPAAAAALPALGEILNLQAPWAGGIQASARETVAVIRGR